MSEQKNTITTTWMWPASSGGVHGLTIDTIDNKLLWFDDAVACACGDYSVMQTFAHFDEKGPKLSIPDDVLAELQDSLQQLRESKQDN